MYVGKLRGADMGGITKFQSHQMGGIAKLYTRIIGGSQKYRDRIPTDFVVPPCRYLGYVPYNIVTDFGRPNDFPAPPKG